MTLNNMNTKRVIFIVGPTAVGKTTLSIELAKRINTEIISCDSRQFYKELLIGSAPPSPKELAEIKHHFIHNLSVTEEYSAGQFEIDVLKLIKELHKKNHTLIVVGGSGLYVDAICKGFDKFPKVSKNTREELNLLYKRNNLRWLQNEVQKIDPEFYNACDINNHQRLLRALEVYSDSGKKLSSYQTKKPKKREFEIIKIGLNIDRKKLYNRINKRVDRMIQDGLLEETSSLITYQKKNALQTVGYKEIFGFLNNETTLEKAIENIKQNTRRFAKRQLTWFKKDPNIKWFETSQIDDIKKFIGL